MSQSAADRRKVENEVVFRQYNEQIQHGFDEITRLAKEDGQDSFHQPTDDALYFYCECSDENCHKRVLVKPSQYNKIHLARDQFIIICGHESEAVERIVIRTNDYCVVRKNEKPPKTASQLQPTDADNS